MTCGDIRQFAPLYLSGELGELGEFERGGRSAFEAHLAECRQCATYVQEHAMADVRLRNAFSTELPDTAALERAVRRRIADERSRRWKIVAGIAAAILVAIAVGFRTMGPAPVARLYTDIARDHRLEVIEHQPRRWRSETPQIDTLTSRYGLPGPAALALAPPGYRLEHAKTCGIDGQPVLHLVYTDGAREFSVYIQNRAGGKVFAEPAGEPAMRVNGKVVHGLSVSSEHMASFRAVALMP